MWNVYAAVLTLGRYGVAIGRGHHAQLLGGAETPAVEEDRQVDNIPHVVVPVDVGVSQDAVEVLVDGFDDDVRVACKDGDEGAFREEHPHLSENK